jgi:cell division protein FtsQ
MTAAFKPVDAAVVRRAAAREARGSTRAALEAGLRTLAAAVLSAALSFGAWQAWRWATRSAVFAIREIDFSGVERAAEPDLLRRSGLSPGGNLFRADLSRAARGIETHPWVVSARLDRRLPGTVLASVVEHRPAALVQLGALYVLDEEARLFKRAAPEDGLDLPIITGLGREDWQARRPELQLRLLAALHLRDTWKASGLSVGALSELRLDDDGGVTLFAHEGAAGSAGAGDGVQEIRLGAGEISLKLRRLAQVRAALARRGERATRIDLDNPARPDQAAATLAEKR